MGALEASERLLVAINLEVLLNLKGLPIILYRLPDPRHYNKLYNIIAKLNKDYKKLIKVNHSRLLMKVNQRNG